MRCVEGSYKHRRFHGAEIAAALGAQASRFNLRDYHSKIDLLRAIASEIRALKFASKNARREGHCSLVTDHALRELQFASWVLHENRRSGWTNSVHHHLQEDMQLNDGMFIRAPNRRPHIDQECLRISIRV